MSIATKIEAMSTEAVQQHIWHCDDELRSLPRALLGSPIVNTITRKLRLERAIAVKELAKRMEGKK